MGGNDFDRYDEGEKASVISLIINILLAIAKIVIGFIFNSKALLADGFHSVSDVFSTLIIMISIRISRRPPDERHPYGHGKAESIATKLLGLILVFTGLFLIRDVVSVIRSGDISVPGYPVLIVALISILTKELLCQYIGRIGEKINSKGLIADAYHHRSDALSSVAALIGAGGAYLGFPILDPLAGGLVAGFIIKVGVEIWLDATNELMDATPESLAVDEIISELEKLNDVLAIKDIKFRSYGNNIYVDLRVVVSNDLSVVEGHKIAVDVQKRIKEFDINILEVLVHIDPELIYDENK